MSAQDEPRTAGPSPRITVQRTGGFAGLSDTVALDPQGGWSVVGRAGAGTTGHLTEQQLTAMRKLAADPRLAGEATRTPPPTRCRDAFHYVLTVGATRVSYTRCPADPDQPAASIALVDQLLQFTTGGSG